MGQAYPAVRGQALITETLKLEESRFRKTLSRGLGLLEDATANLKAGDMLDGETAFKLYDTYGFPLDLTQDALRQRDISVNLDGFRMRWSGRRPRRARTGLVQAKPPPRQSGSLCAKNSARRNFLATIPSKPKAWCWRW
jgi:alanyl-tRNA synthetase